MRFLAPVLLLMPLMSFAAPQFETLKTLDGGVQYCNSKEDFGKGGFFLEYTLVEDSTKAADAFEISFGPTFYRCSHGANGYEWQPGTINDLLRQKVKTDDGIVRIVPLSYKWVVYSENYKELNPEPTVTKSGLTKYTVNVRDLLANDQKSRHRRGLESRGIVTVFLKYTSKAIYPNGEELFLGTRASGSFNIIITLPSR